MGFLSHNTASIPVIQLCIYIMNITINSMKLIGILCSNEILFTEKVTWLWSMVHSLMILDVQNQKWKQIHYAIRIFRTFVIRAIIHIKDSCCQWSLKLGIQIHSSMISYLVFTHDFFHKLHKTWRNLVLTYSTIVNHTMGAIGVQKQEKSQWWLILCVGLARLWCPVGQTLVWILSWSYF